MRIPSTKLVVVEFEIDGEIVLQLENKYFSRNKLIKKTLEKYKEIFGLSMLRDDFLSQASHSLTDLVVHLHFAHKEFKSFDLCVLKQQRATRSKRSNLHQWAKLFKDILTISAKQLDENEFKKVLDKATN